jgi:hypothetical protein
VLAEPSVADKPAAEEVDHMGYTGFGTPVDFLESLASAVLDLPFLGLIQV